MVRGSYPSMAATLPVVIVRLDSAIAGRHDATRARRDRTGRLRTAGGVEHVSIPPYKGRGQARTRPPGARRSVGYRAMLGRLSRRLRGDARVQKTAARAPAATEVSPQTPLGDDYQTKLEQEIAFHKDYLDVSALPEIAGYWANTYVLPLLVQVGAADPNDFVANGLLTGARRSEIDCPRFISIGAGNCDTEIALSRRLREAGLDEFVFTCLDINPHMLERGTVAAAEAGLAELIKPVIGDFNSWTPDQPYEGVLANQALHHVTDLEHLLDSVRQALAPGATFVINDMIGRNGHRRWPEALAIVNEFWSELPTSYRYNQQLNRMEEQFGDWDCSQYGFEGVRAQDILPLLLERFEFEIFIGFGNAVDPFVDRSFGHNFDAHATWDRRFIDRVQETDEEAIVAGRLTPTHMFAVLGADPVDKPYYARGVNPHAAVRRPDVAAGTSAEAAIDS